MDRNDIIESFDSINSIFNIFVAVIACISLFIAFFLLLLASTQNVTDAIWEFGVLRSMGLTKGEGLRIYIYEAYIVVISAAILGTIVGFITAAAVAVQFYSLIEMPITVEVSLICDFSTLILTAIYFLLVPMGALWMHDWHVTGDCDGCGVRPSHCRQQAIGCICHQGQLLINLSSRFVTT